MGSAKKRIATERVVPLGLLVCLTLLLAGCFGRSTPPEPTPEAITLRLVSVDESPAERLLFEAYHELHPHIAVDTEPYSALPVTYLAGSNSVPDLMYVTPGYFLDSAADTGKLTDLSDLWERTGLTSLFPPGLAQLSEHGGKQYFVPVGYQWSAIYYNIELFQQYGIDPPSTWDDLMGAAATLAAAGVTPFALAGQDSWLSSLWFSYLNIRLHGPEFHRELMAGRVPYTDPRVLDALALWNWLFEQGYFAAEAGTTDRFEALMSTIRGDDGKVEANKTAMVLASPIFMNELPAAFRQELDFFPVPAIDPALPIGEVAIASGYMVPNDAPNRDEALDFLTFAVSEEGLSLLAEQALFEESIPVMGVDRLGSVPESMQRGQAIIERADQVDVGFIFGVPVEVQDAFEAALRTMVGQVESDGSFDVQAVAERLEAANQQ